MYRVLTFLFVLLSHVFVYGQCPIIPTPEEYHETDGHFLITDKLEINRKFLPETMVDFVAAEFRLLGVKTQWVSTGGDIVFQDISTVPPSGYRITVEDKIYIATTSDDGLFFAFNSLFQLIKKRKGIHYINNVVISDQPKYEWRGLHLDVSRHFFTVEEIKKFIDIMALYKFNKFHWHLTDDQGWRIEIKKYPRLTAIGGFRDSTLIGHYSDQPRQYDKSRYGGFYTQDEICDVVAYAASKYIDVVPEIEMPGHSRAALAAYPELSCTGKEQGVPGIWGVFDDIYCSKPETITFMKEVLSEVLELFPSEYIHIGGDEAPKTRWKECDDCQKVIRENNLTDEHELQSYFIRQIDEFLTSKGRKLIGWDEILEGGLSPNAAVMSWRAEAGGIEAAKQGHSVVMSPTTYCYFDYYQSSHDSEPLAIGGYLPLDKVYQYDPAPKELSPDEAGFILGGQANLWTEYMESMDHVEYMAYPRALALIQSLWCVNKPDYNAFLKDYLDYHEKYLKLHGVNVAESIHYPDMWIERAASGIEVRFKTPDPTDKFSLAIDYHSGGNWVAGIVHKELEVPSSYPITIERSVAQRVNLSLNSSKFTDTLQYVFVPTNNLGCEIEMVTEPHPKYNHNGSLNLVDGIRGGGRWKGNEWLGFRENRIEFILDLGEVKELKKFKIGLLERNGSWIYLPERIVLQTSEDGKSWSEKIVNGDPQGGMNTINLSGSSQYVKVILETMDRIPEGMNGAGTVPWTFVDEVEIIEVSE